ncbi:MAG TPA: single-stranded DNA-binding protein [Solirubrobacteraceae bacterium]|jgi:single-strand DNA-binding protein
MSYSNINRIVIVGRLTADPELRALSSGASVCSIRLASHSLRRNADGERTEKPNFFDVSVFGQMGESVHRYMSRGRRIAIDGHLHWREWDTPEGAKRQAVEIVAERVQFLDGRGPQASSQELGQDDGSTDSIDSLNVTETVEERELVGVGSGSLDEDLVF